MEDGLGVGSSDLLSSCAVVWWTLGLVGDSESSGSGGRSTGLSVYHRPSRCRFILTFAIVLLLALLNRRYPFTVACTRLEKFIHMSVIHHVTVGRYDGSSGVGCVEGKPVDGCIIDYHFDDTSSNGFEVVRYGFVFALVCHY
jgi:hypothetical protein